MNDDDRVGPRLLVLSALFPNAKQPQGGLFIRERMFRVAERFPVVVVSPKPWFPLQSLLRRVRPDYRPCPGRHERQGSVDVFFPRFLALPLLGRRFDGFFMALGAWGTVRRLQKDGRADLIDAHFAYPDGYAARWLARWLGMPYCVTLRGTEPRLCRQRAFRRRVLAALAGATHVIAVANALREAMVAAGADGSRITRVGNGVDVDKFRPLEQGEARAALAVEPDVPVLISVGGLVPRKGFHRVIRLLPRLRREFPRIRYLIVGGASPEGNFGGELRSLAAAEGVAEHVDFLGHLPPEQLRVPLSAADVFVLATENEGWANVFLEAMACGLPVVTTRVGGNEEVVTDATLGALVPPGDTDALAAAIAAALRKSWSREHLRRHALENQWADRVDDLAAIFQRLPAPDRSGAR